MNSNIDKLLNFIIDEIDLNIQEAMSDYNEKGSLSALAILFDFQTGLRLDELVGHEDERTTYHIHNSINQKSLATIDFTMVARLKIKHETLHEVRGGTSALQHTEWNGEIRTFESLPVRT